MTTDTTIEMGETTSPQIPVERWEWRCNWCMAWKKPDDKKGTVRSHRGEQVVCADCVGETLELHTLTVGSDMALRHGS